MTSQGQIADAVKSWLDSGPGEVVVAYSGGLDSHVLLHCVAQLKPAFAQHKYRAIHVHHGLSPNADHWLTRCQAVCHDLDIEFSATHVQVDPAHPDGPEAAARIARYQALSELTTPGSMIFLAQHADDQVETFLLQMLRGAGPKGLSAMPVEGQLDNRARIIRPLLGIRRSALADYAQQADLHWQEDESNQDSRFDRNYLRANIVPMLRQRWPELAKSIGRSARLCAQQQALLDQTAQRHLVEIKNANGSLDIPNLLSHSQPWQDQIVRCWLAGRSIPMPSEKILQQLPELIQAKQDANPLIAWQGWQFRRFRKQLFCIVKPAQKTTTAMEITLDEPIMLCDGRCILISACQCIPPAQCQRLGVPAKDLSVRYGQFASRFKPAGERHSKPLKQWFKHWHIPPWERQTAGLIYYQDNLIGVILADRLMLAESEDDGSGACLRFIS